MILTVRKGGFLIKTVANSGESGIIEERGWITKNGRHIYIGDDGGGSSGGSSFDGLRKEPKLYSNGGSSKKNAKEQAFEQYHSDWQKASLSEKMKLLKKPVAGSGRTPDKVIYSSSETTLTIVYDKKYNYFRIQDTAIKGETSYMDINGKPLSNNIMLPNGKQRGRTKDERRKATHFFNTDKEGGNK